MGVEICPVARVWGAWGWVSGARGGPNQNHMKMTTTSMCGLARVACERRLYLYVMSTDPLILLYEYMQTRVRRIRNED